MWLDSAYCTTCAIVVPHINTRAHISELEQGWEGETHTTQEHPKHLSGLPSDGCTACFLVAAMHNSPEHISGGGGGVELAADVVVGEGSVQLHCSMPWVCTRLDYVMYPLIRFQSTCWTSPDQFGQMLTCFLY